MKRAQPLPVTVDKVPVQLHAPQESAPQALPRVERRKRTGPALHASPLGKAGDILSVNLLRGCVHHCAFCPARAYPSYPGDAVIHLYTDTIERLRQELAARRQAPRAVYISPSTDPFPPLNEVQAEAGRVVALLAEHGVTSWLMTRGYIRPSALDVLTTHRDRVKVTIGITTVNRQLQRVLEPLAAPPRLRLRQIAELRRRGITVNVALEPLIPGVTDTRENLEDLLEALAEAGVHQVTAGYLFLRQGITDNLVRALQPLGVHQEVLAAFQGGPILENGNIAAARYLSKRRRQHGYSALMALAAGLGISVRVAGLTNPDFAPPRPIEADVPTLRQMLLPMF
jgi:DNA repair photolyase